jgi:filamentous hemagglutinin family protein
MNRIQLIVSSLFLSNFFIFKNTSVNAQITPDTTLGNESSQINSNVLIKGFNADQVNGGATRGSNLFHSFSEFNIKDGQRVYFANPSGVFNILTRVTGKDASSIFGTLGVDGNANLFLMNPNGILFGKNASLDVQGSFIGTTANALQFGNQGVFSATNPEAPALLTINPNALVFSQQQSGAVISNQSQAVAGIDPAGFDALGLRVPDGKSLLLVSGNVSIDGGQLNAYGGRVELGGLAEVGNVDLLFNRDNLSLKFPENVTRADVSLTNQASVYVEAAGGGDIAINARNAEILGGSGLFAGIGQGLGIPDTVAGNINLNATGEIQVASGSQVRNLVRTSSQGKGGNITIDSGLLSLRNGAVLNTSTSGSGNAGNIIIRSKDAVSLNSAYIRSNVGAGGVGRGGNIDINAASLFLRDGAQIQAAINDASGTRPAGRGDAGNVNVTLTGVVDIAGAKNDFASAIDSRADTGTVGNAGNITIYAGSFKLGEGGGIATSTLGQGNAGNITIRAKDSVSITDGNIFSTVEAGGVGKGGNIEIDAASLSLTDGATLLTFTRKADGSQPAGQGDAGNVKVRVTGNFDISGSKNGSPSGIRSLVSEGTVGNGGDITIYAGSFSLRDGARFNASIRGEGNAGNIDVNVTGATTISGNKNGEVSAIFSDVVEGGKGNGGNITINAGSLSLIDSTQLITSTSGEGNAGNITVRAKDSVFLTDNTAIISTVEAGGVGKGGNINIDAASLTLLNAGQLQALTRPASDTLPAGRGDAGDVNIKVTGVVNIAGEKNGFISAIGTSVGTGAIGNGGNITIDAATFSLLDGAQARTANFGQGNVGNIEINSPKITLDNQGKLNAESAFGNGGNINVNSDILLLRRGGQISTTAGTAQSAGDGGNINLNTKFIVAVPKENSDILANAFTGKGGNVNIQTQGIFGIEPRSKPTNQSDITASSELGVQGQVSIQKPDVDPNRGLIQLPGGLKDQSEQIDQFCGRGRIPLGRFVVVGKNGSIQSNPVVNPMQGEIDFTPLATLDESNSTNRANRIPDSLMVQKQPQNRIVEAQAIVRDAEGTLYLVAEAPNVTPYSRPAVSSCAAVGK